MMKRFISSMLFVVMCSISCFSKTTSEAAKEIPKGRYAIKSGIVEYKTEVMGMAGKQTSTFDDYGNLEVIETTMEMMGIKINTVTLMRDGYIYTFDMENKTGTRIVGNSPNIDFENLSDEMAQDMNLKKTGTETFLGKNCDNMSIDYTKMNMKGNFLVYKGVPLKIDTDMGTMKMILVGEKFEENPAIPAGKFEIPSGFTITNL
ncbi:MAG: hypothetical protein R6W31_20170 [Bacteroidales bacterium]